MNIAMMTNSYAPFTGGVTVSVDRLTRGLRRAGHAVTVFAPEYPEATHETDHADDVVRCRAMGSAGVFRAPSLFDTKPFKEFRRRRYDLVHVHQPMLMGNTGWLLSRLHGLPLVFTWHTLYWQYTHNLGFIRGLEEGERNCKSRLARRMAHGVRSFFSERVVPWYIRAYARRCDTVFVPSRGIRVALGDMGDKNVAVLPTGIPDFFFSHDENRTKEIRKRWARGGKLFCSVSRLAREKNIGFLLQGLAAYKRLYGRGFSLLLIGDGPERRELERTAQRFKLRENVFFLGELPNEELRHYYAASDAFLFASKSETQGIVLLEAMAGKTPVVALNASGVCDVVRDGWNGRLADERPEAFARAVRSLTQDVDAAARAAACAQDTARRYSSAAVATQAEAAYLEAIARKKAAKRWGAAFTEARSGIFGEQKWH